MLVYKGQATLEIVISADSTDQDDKDSNNSNNTYQQRLSAPQVRIQTKSKYNRKFLSKNRKCRLYYAKVVSNQWTLWHFL